MSFPVAVEAAIVLVGALPREVALLSARTTRIRLTAFASTCNQPNPINHVIRRPLVVVFLTITLEKRNGTKTTHEDTKEGTCVNDKLEKDPWPFLLVFLSLAPTHQFSCWDIPWRSVLLDDSSGTRCPRPRCSDRTPFRPSCRIRSNRLQNRTR